MAATLNTEGMMSVQRIHDFLSAVLDLPVCAGTVSAMVKELAFRLGGTVQAIVRALMASPVNNADETGFRVEGVLYWLHSVCNELFTYLAVHERRGEEGMRAIGFLPEYQGVIVSDCPGDYWKFDNLSHAICNAHILRELKGVHESDPKVWAEDMRSLLREMRLFAPTRPLCRPKPYWRSGHAMTPFSNRPPGRIRFLSVSPDSAEGLPKNRFAVSLTL